MAAFDLAWFFFVEFRTYVGIIAAVTLGVIFFGMRHGDDGPEGRLVSQHTFTEGWPGWEMHPKGEEVVICIDGAMDLTQEFPDGTRKTSSLEAGEFIINPRGVWHIADVEESATAIFITAGEGTEHRPR